MQKKKKKILVSVFISIKEEIGSIKQVSLLSKKEKRLLGNKRSKFKYSVGMVNDRKDMVEKPIGNPKDNK